MARTPGTCCGVWVRGGGRGDLNDRHPRPTAAATDHDQDEARRPSPARSASLALLASSCQNPLPTQPTQPPRYYGFGAGLSVRYGGAKATITDKSTVTQNLNKYGHGGGIAAISGALEVSDGSKVTDNLAVSGTAGGIYLFDSEATIEDSVVAGNTAFLAAGGIDPLGTTQLYMFGSVL